MGEYMSFWTLLNVKDGDDKSPRYDSTNSDSVVLLAICVGGFSNH